MFIQVDPFLARDQSCGWTMRRRLFAARTRPIAAGASYVFSQRYPTPRLLTDPLARGRELTLLRTTQTGRLAAINAILQAPVVNRLVAAVQVMRDGGDAWA